LYLKKALQEEFLFTSPCTIRGFTTKANIVYSSKQYSSSKEQEQLLKVKEYIESYFAKFSSLKDKVLVFCLTVAKVKGLSKLLSCPAYYFALKEEEKEEVLKSYFTSNREKIFVSSPSLKEGIDYLSIRLIVYIDFVYSFIGFL
jgi:superfamily II DNA helicase RecQ